MFGDKISGLLSFLWLGAVFIPFYLLVPFADQVNLSSRFSSNLVLVSSSVISILTPLCSALAGQVLAGQVVCMNVLQGFCLYSLTGTGFFTQSITSAEFTYKNDGYNSYDLIS